jgi:AcrR family transcriptional regulator
VAANERLNRRPGPPPSSARGDETRARLLQAAGEEFAATGYRAANVRAICRAARANVSAIKYHFGSKEELYRAVMATARGQLLDGEPPPSLRPGEDPRDVLPRLLRWFLRLVLLERPSSPWIGRLLAFEAADPTGALDEFVATCALPIRTELERVVQAIVGPGVPKRRRGDLTNAVVALCVNQKHSAAILERLGYPPPRDPAGIDRLAELLARFALSGLQGFQA